MMSEMTRRCCSARRLIDSLHVQNVACAASMPHGFNAAAASLYFSYHVMSWRLTSLRADILLFFALSSADCFVRTLEYSEWLNDDCAHLTLASLSL